MALQCLLLPLSIDWHAMQHTRHTTPRRDVYTHSRILNESLVCIHSTKLKYKTGKSRNQQLYHARWTTTWTCHGYQPRQQARNWPWSATRKYCCREGIADIIRTTPGPRSMLKMLLDAMGGIVMTNDGNCILREIDVSHPAAKSMLELSRAQDEEVGDGTTMLSCWRAKCCPLLALFWNEICTLSSSSEHTTKRCNSTRCLWFYCKDCGHLRSRCIAQGCPRLVGRVRKPLGRLPMRPSLASGSTSQYRLREWQERNWY